MGKLHQIVIIARGVCFHFGCNIVVYDKFKEIVIKKLFKGAGRHEITFHDLKEDVYYVAVEKTKEGRDNPLGDLDIITEVD